MCRMSRAQQPVGLARIPKHRESNEQQGMSSMQNNPPLGILLSLPTLPVPTTPLYRTPRIRPALRARGYPLEFRSPSRQPTTSIRATSPNPTRPMSSPKPSTFSPLPLDSLRKQLPIHCHGGQHPHHVLDRPHVPPNTHHTHQQQEPHLHPNIHIYPPKPLPNPTIGRSR